MKLTLGVVILSLLLFASVDQTLAQSYPTKPIVFIVPWTPGGSNDVAARMVAQKLQEAWGQPVLVENHPGAGGIIGAQLVKNSAPDGYTVLFTSTTQFTQTVHLYAKAPYDTFNDFVPVALIGEVPMLLMVNPSVPAKSVKELVALAMAKPDSLAYGSVGIGGLHHVIAELFSAQAGIKMVHVPYKGAVPAIMDLLSGQIQVTFSALNSILPYIKSGGARALGVATVKRIPSLPDLPTIDEGGVHGIYGDATTCILVPKGTSPDIVNKMNREVNKIISNPDFVNRFRAQGMETIPGTPAEFAINLRDGYERWGKVIKGLGMRFD